MRERAYAGNPGIRGRDVTVLGAKPILVAGPGCGSRGEGCIARQHCEAARPRVVLVDGVKELVAICHRDPGIAHPDVELALVFLVGALRKLCAVGRHPPCVVGFRSHRPAFSVCQHPGSLMICLSRLASVRLTTQGEQFLSLRADARWNEIKPSVFLTKREK